MSYRAAEHVSEILVFISYSGFEPRDQISYLKWKHDAEEQEKFQRFKRDIESEFGGKFVATSIGPNGIGGSPDTPALVTTILGATIPAWTIIVGTFFLGKSIKGNFDAWIEMATAIRKYFSRPVFFSRHGAAIIAVKAVFDEMGGTPKKLKLSGYRRLDHAPPNYPTVDIKDIDGLGEIDDAPPTCLIGYTAHVFEIEADGVLFRVSVVGDKSKILKLDS